MTGEAFNAKVRELLPQSLRSQIGSVLHSPVSTVKPGDVYVLGMNPAMPDIRRTIDQYLDWRLIEPGRHSLLDSDREDFRSQLVSLLEAVGQDVRKTCFSNLVFKATPKVGPESLGLADQCWPVHQFILTHVRPRWILSVGNSRGSAYSYLKRRYADSLRRGPRCPSGHGDTEIKALVGAIDGCQTAVVAIPHPCRFYTKNVTGLCDLVQRVAATRPTVSAEM